MEKRSKFYLRSNEMKFTILTFFAISLLQSCVIIGLTNDFEKLTPAYRALIHPFNKIEEVEIGKIYKINALQLKGEIKKHPRSIVYIFANGCSSPVCLPLYTYERYAQAHGYKLFLVMVGYNDLKETLNQKIEIPLFAIDNEYYNKNIRSTYIRYFTNELLGYPINTKYKERKFRGNLFFFENGKIIDVFLGLPN